MGKVEIKQALAVLFASFYVFNVHYPAGCSNFYLLYLMYITRLGVAISTYCI